MAKVLITEGYLSDIADAIREKKASEDTYTPAEMADAIESIQTGTAPTGTINISTNGTHDVTDYANANVSVPTGTARSSSDLTASNLTVTAPAGLYAENATKTLSDANLVAGNIKKDVTIFGTTGTYEGGGGGSTDVILRDVLNGTVTSYEDDLLTTLKTTIPKTLTSFICHNISSIDSGVMVVRDTNVTTLALPSLTSYNQRSAFSGSTKLQSVDLALTGLVDLYFDGDSALATIVLRSQSRVPLPTVNTLRNTRFASGKAGGTIYIPRSLYDHLGDGTDNDYKANANWATVDGYGTITWAQIEGSYYETHYADGTLIPS